MSGAGLNDPISYPQNWDVFIIGGVASPGLCVVSGFKRSNTWDVKTGKGTLGATITFTAQPPARGTVTFKAWTAAHFAAWDTFYPVFKYDPTKKKVTGVDVYHPALADVDIGAVVTEDISIWEHKGNGLYERTVDLLEYFPTPPKPAIGTPSTATGGAGYHDLTLPGKKLDDASTTIQTGTDSLTGAAGSG